MAFSKKQKAAILVFYDWLMAPDRAYKEVTSAFLADCHRYVEIKSSKTDNGLFDIERLSKKDRNELNLIEYKLQVYPAVIDDWTLFKQKAG